MRLNRILITGCGGDIAISAAKILRDLGFNDLFGTDIHSSHPGDLFYQRCFVVSKAGDPGYLDQIRELVSGNNISIIIPLSEPELAQFNSVDNRELAGAQIVMANAKSIHVGLNKIRTARFLEDSGLPYPWTKKVSDGDPKDLPCIIKHPESQGGKSVNIVSENLVSYYIENFSDHIWQELLLPEAQEYTCGLYRSKTGEIRIIQFRRQLSHGVTVSGEVATHSSINRLLESLANVLELEGSINVQLRLTDMGPVIFEINPRFSSTIRFRHLLGYQDLLWSLQELEGEKIGNYTPPQKGRKIYLGAEEYILSDKF